MTVRTEFRFIVTAVGERHMVEVEVNGKTVMKVEGQPAGSITTASKGLDERRQWTLFRIAEMLAQERWAE